MPRLFKVEFIAKDTRLGASLVALEGIAIGRPEVTPIRGAKVSGKKVRAVNEESIIDSIAKVIGRQSPGSVIQRVAIKGLIERFGGNANGTSPVIDRLKKRGVLKGQGTGIDGYKIVRSK